MADKLFLKNVTLCIISTDKFEPSKFALQYSLNLIVFQKVLFFTSVCNKFDISPGVQLVHIDSFKSISDYNYFIINCLHKFINTTHVLVIQWDGFVLNPQLWSEDFLNYDYIGAYWPHFNGPHNVGNGGFSLRSKKLLKILSMKSVDYSIPEDVQICINLRNFLEDKYRIKFAPIEISNNFSSERPFYNGYSFGFHGFFNIPFILSYTDTITVLQCLNRIQLRQCDIMTFTKNLFHSSRYTIVQKLKIFFTAIKLILNEN